MNFKIKNTSGHHVGLTIQNEHIAFMTIHCDTENVEGRLLASQHNGYPRRTPHEPPHFPKTMPQSKGVILMKVHQSCTNTCPIAYPSFILVVKWSTNIHYSHTIPILYETWYVTYNILHILHGYWFVRFGLLSSNIALFSSSTGQIRSPSSGLQSCVMRSSLCFMVGLPSSCMKNRNCLASFVLNRWWASLWRYDGKHFGLAWSGLESTLILIMRMNVDHLEFSTHSKILVHVSHDFCFSKVWMWVIICACATNRLTNLHERIGGKYSWRLRGKPKILDPHYLFPR